MSGRGIDFLENWVNQNIRATDRKGSRDRATELSAQCYADAAKLGITIDDREPEWGSVEKIIFDAMQDVMGDELEYWKIFAAVRERREKVVRFTNKWWGKTCGSANVRLNFCGGIEQKATKEI